MALVIRLSPKILLASLCIFCVLLFIDRGAISSNGVGGGGKTKNGIAVQWGLSGFQSGCIPAICFAGLMVGAPLFGQLAKHHHEKILRLISLGAVIFSLGTLTTGFAPNYASLLVFRFIVGLSNGALIALAPPLIG